MNRRMLVYSRMLDAARLHVAAVCRFEQVMVEFPGMTDVESALVRLPFEFVVTGIPKSVQAKRSSIKRWQTRVATAAKMKLPSWATPVDGRLRTVVVWYSTNPSTDTDNILKPIHDALNQLVYVDDSTVTDITAAKRDLETDFQLVNPAQDLLLALATKADFVHIRVERAPAAEEYVR